MKDLKDAAKRVQAAAVALGLDVQVVEMEHSTRTADEAAKAAGCDVGQIVKSLVFRGKASGKPYMLLVSGKNRVNEKAVSKVLGDTLTRPDAQYVRDLTGYAIGGIPPLGHREPIETWMDLDLLAYEVVWAAAGTPETIFSASPVALAEKTGAKTLSVT